MSARWREAVLRHRREDTQEPIYVQPSGSSPVSEDGIGGKRRRSRFRVRTEGLPDGVRLNPAAWLLDLDGLRYYVEASLVVPGGRYINLLTVFRWPTPAP